jgi:hypothetical protein
MADIFDEVAGKTSTATDIFDEAASDPQLQARARGRSDVEIGKAAQAPGSPFEPQPVDQGLTRPDLGAVPPKPRPQAAAESQLPEESSYHLRPLGGQKRDIFDSLPQENELQISGKHPQLARWVTRTTDTPGRNLSLAEPASWCGRHRGLVRWEEQGRQRAGDGSRRTGLRGTPEGSHRQHDGARHRDGRFRNRAGRNRDQIA